MSQHPYDPQQKSGPPLQPHHKIKPDLNPSPNDQHQTNKPLPNLQLKKNEADRNPLPKCQDPLPKCQGPLPKCQDPLPKCQDPLGMKVEVNLRKQGVEKKEQKQQNSKESEGEVQENILKIRKLAQMKKQIQLVQKDKVLNKNQVKRNKLEQRKDIQYEQAVKPSPQLAYQSRISVYLQRYLHAIPIDLTDSEISRKRADQKQKLFKNFILAVLQIQDKKDQDLNQKQKQEGIKYLNENQVYTKVMDMCIQLDNCLQKDLVLKWNMRRFLKAYKQFNVNLADQHNQQLRSRIITKELPIKQIPTMPEQYFYPQPKKKRLRQKQQFYLREAQNPKDVEEQRLRKQQAKKKKLEEKVPIEFKPEPKTRHYNQDKLLQLNQYLGQQIPECLKQNLEMLDEQKNLQFKDSLTKNLEQVFEGAENKEKAKDQ